MKHSGVCILHEDNGLFSLWVNDNAIFTSKSLEAAEDHARRHAKRLGVQIIRVRERTREQIIARSAFRNRGCH